MATAEEFNVLYTQYTAEVDPKKKAEILELMRKNVLERNGNNDVFKTLHSNIVIRISQADNRDLLEISHNLQEIKRRKQWEIKNDKEREMELGKNKHSKEHPYSDFNYSDHK